jgi:hypothetical protein
MAQERPRYTLMELVMVIILAGLVLGLYETVARPVPVGARTPVSIYVCCGGLIVWSIVWRSLRARRRAPTCQECGRRFIPPERKQAAGPPICPRCHQRHLTPVQARKEGAKGKRALLMIALWVTVVFGIFLWVPIQTHFPEAFWIALPIAALAATFGLLAGLILVVAAYSLVKNWLLQSESRLLARARKAARCEGDVTRIGGITIWCSGPDDPVPMLTKELETARSRFASMFATSDSGPHRLRVLHFATRAGFEGFHGTALNLSSVDGLYAGIPSRTITNCSEVMPTRPANPEWMARLLFGFALLDAYRGSTPPSWLQQGIANSIAAGGGAGPLARLNRKMLVAIAKGTTLAPDDLFSTSKRKLVKLVTGIPDHARFAELRQFNSQAWSLVEYLAGPTSTGDRREHFRAFVKDRQLKRGGESVFEGHFGFGYERLFEGWREWVRARGVGSHEPPAPNVQEILVGRLVPMILDPQARIMDRIEAIRSMGSSGYLPGADTLIDVLREPGEVPREEVVWALESISGLALGDDPEAWNSWWHGLPEPVRTIG